MEPNTAKDRETTDAAASRMEERTWKQVLPPGCWPWIAVVLTLSVFGGTVWYMTMRLEQQIQRQTVARDGEVLQAVMVMQQLAEQETDPGFTPDAEADQFQLLLKASRLKGVMGVRLFDREGRLVTTFPEYVPAAKLGDDDLLKLKQLQPASRLDRTAQPWRTSGSGRPVRSLEATPVLEALVPIHRGQGTELLGVGQFITDGQTVVARLDSLHRALLVQAWMVFGVGGALIVLGLGWTLNRLQQRTAMLVKANRELALAAKTAAVGAISAQLIHGLKSPLFGVQSLLSGRSHADEADPAMQTALRATQRMGGTINRIMAMLRDQEGLMHLNRPAQALADDLRRVMEPLAGEKEVKLGFSPAPEVVMPAQVSNLVQIILNNLLQNAIEATPAGKSVSLVMRRERDDDLVFEVRDEGPGVAGDLRDDLFLPCESRKPGGGGVGLSISQQLARHMGGELELLSSGRQGSVFVFHLPATHLTKIQGGASRNLELPLLA
jgi:signal transduction histidine kinase